MRRTKGFTLIELMIVVSIIAILAALAIPQYQDYVVRSRWSDNVSHVAGIKQAIAECAQSNNGVIVIGTCDTIPNLVAAQFLALNFAVPSPPNAKYLAVPVGVAGGVITLVGNVQAANCVVTLTPTFPAGTAAVTWDIATSALPATCSSAKTGLRN